jgi:hypothetical protein
MERRGAKDARTSVHRREHLHIHYVAAHDGTSPRLPLQVRTTQLVLGSGDPTTMPPPLRASLVPSRALEAAGKLAGKMRHQDNAAL